MSTEAETQRGTDTVAARRQPDVRRLTRVAAACLMPVGPAAVAVLRFIIPGEPIGESITAQPGAQRAVVVLGILIAFTLLPGALAALRLLRPVAPRLTTWTGVILIPSYLALLAGSGMDWAPLAALDAGFSPAEIDRLVGGIWTLPAIVVYGAVFVIGHIIGNVLLGATMIVTRTAPVLVGVLTLVAQPLHLVAVIGEWRLLDLCAWGLTAVGMGFLAWAVLRTPDDDWDVPPLSRRRRSVRG